ncbi:MAG: glycosyltransferase [Candidatus Pacebacteria bacterium]|nr:glycosyltransferase [Candidatus Paceibacterota bacterium]
MIRIGVDCRLAGPKNAGIGRYIENLIIRLPGLSLAERMPEIKWVFFFLDQEQLISARNQISHPELVEFALTPIRHYTFGEQLRLPINFIQKKLDLLHVPHFNAPLLYPGKLVLTIHDLLWHKQTGLHMTTLKPWQYHLKYLAYRRVTRAAINKSRLIFVPTQTVQKIVSQIFPQASQKISVTYEGYNSIFDQPTAPNYQKRTKSLIYLGSLYPHKNLQLVIRALQKLPDWKLKIIGSREIFKDRLIELSQELGVKDQLTWLGYLPDKKLIAEFNQSLALVQPSISEGFGLTGIEAMAAGLPVLASEIDTFQEIYQTAPAYFNPRSVESFLTAISKLSQKKQWQQSQKTGRAVATNFSWDKMAEQTLQGYVSQI